MLRYDVRTGVKKIKTKTAIIASTIALGLGGAAFGVALPFAAHASSTSDYCGTSANGCSAAYAAGAQCGTGAGSGTFGALGKGNNLGIATTPGNGNPEHATWLGSYPGPGTDGQATGANNSSICGNRPASTY